jgi:O-antigen/teichoic acid export membrane protein
MRWVLRHQAKIFPLLDIALNAVNYLFNVYVAWHLSPAEFGVTTTLLAVLSLLLVTGVSLQLYTAKQVAEGIGQGAGHGDTVRGIRRSAVVLTAAIAGGFVVCFVPLHLLTRGSYAALGLVLVAFVLNAFLSVDRGVLQGSHRFLQLNVNFYIEVGAKVLALILLLTMAASKELVLLAIVVGMIAALVHARRATAPAVAQESGVDLPARLHHVPRVAKILAATFFTYFFTAADLVVVNYFLPEQSGYFAVALKYTQVLLFACLSLVTVFIPLLSAAKADPPLFVRRVRTLLGLVLGLIVAVAMVYAVVAAPTVGFFFGQKYAPAAQYVLLDCLPYALLILNFVAINLHVVFDRTGYLWVLLSGAVALVALLLVFHGSIATMLLIETLVFAAMLAGQLILLSRSDIPILGSKRHPHAGAPGQPVSTSGPTATSTGSVTT